MKRIFRQMFSRCGAVLLAGFALAHAAASPFDCSDISGPDFFPILPWDAQHGWKSPFTNRTENGLDSIAECHFNVAGFVYPRDLRQCQKLGLGAIMLPLENASIPNNYTKEWVKLSDEEIDRRVREMVRLSGKNPAVQGYFLMDEPGVKFFPALGKAVAAVKKYAPGKMAYINLFPDYATIGAPDMSQLGTSNYTEYLERFVSEVNPQFISYDNYRVQMSQDLADPKRAASYYRNLLEVRRVAQKHGLPYLNIVSANQIRSFTTIPSPANLLFQAYTTLAAGYRGVTWYTYYSKGYGYAPVNAEGKKTLTWAWLKEVNRQVATLAPIMSRLESTGVFFSEPAPVDGLPVLPGKVVSSVTCATPLMIGEFKHRDGSSYVMIVNLSLEKSAKFAITLQQPGAMQIVSLMDRSLSAFNEQEGLWLTAGQGALLRMASP